MTSATMTDDLTQQAIDFLGSKQIGVVSWTSAEGTPQSATVFYWVNDLDREQGFSVYFVTRRHMRKFQCLRERPAASFVVGTEFEPKTVQIEGVAQLVQSGDDLAMLKEDMEKVFSHPAHGLLYSGEFFPRSPFTGFEETDFGVLKIVPTWARFMTYDADAKKLVFHQLKV